MSKTSLSIQMLEILYSRGIVGIAELARLLDTNPRNIPEYKKVLEEAGYVIDTVPGRYGGYVLNKKYTNTDKNPQNANFFCFFAAC